MAANYTDEQVQYMVKKYTAQPNRDTVDELAQTLNKSIHVMSVFHLVIVIMSWVR